MLQTPPLLSDEQTGTPLDQPGAPDLGGENTTPRQPSAAPVAHTPCYNSATHA